MSRLVTHWGAVCALLLGFMLSLAPQQAQAAGVVGTGTSASCTEAAFDTALSAGGAVTFNCGGPATIILTSRKIITNPTTIDGAGLITLSGNNTTGLLDINAVDFTLSNITLTDGNSDTLPGGAIAMIGANVSLDNVTITRSQTKDHGGGLYCYVGTGGRLSIKNSVFSHNSNDKSGAGVANEGCELTISNTLFLENLANAPGGGLWHEGNTATLSQVEFNSNVGSQGGGIAVSGGDLSVDLARFHQNRGRSHGGAVALSGGSLKISNVTLWRNSAGTAGSTDNDGGGIYQTAGNLSVENSTFAENGTSRFGGALYVNAAQAKLLNVTIANNNASAGKAVYNEILDPPNLTVQNSVFYGEGNICDGPMFTSLGNNAVVGGCSSFTHASDQVGIAASSLGALGDNGNIHGFAMLTMVPSDGGALINKGNAAACPTTDQRGGARVGVCDIGATEYGVLGFKLALPFIRR